MCTASDWLFHTSKRIVASVLSEPMPAGMATLYVQPCFMALGICKNSQWSNSLVSVLSVFIGLDLRQTAKGCAVAKVLSSDELIFHKAAFCAWAAFKRSPNTNRVSSPSANE